MCLGPGRKLAGRQPKDTQVRLLAWVFALRTALIKAEAALKVGGGAPTGFMPFVKMADKDYKRGYTEGYEAAVKSLTPDPETPSQ